MHAACTTTLNISMAFGGKLWPIAPQDMNLGSNGGSMCLGGIFDLTQGSSIEANGGNPTWVVGDTFLVCPPTYFSCLHPSFPSSLRPFVPPFHLIIVSIFVPVSIAVSISIYLSFCSFSGRELS
jgi:hypothetical protein